MAIEPMKIKELTLGTDPATSYTFPSVDGAASEILTTDGNGNISFAAGSGGTIGGSITNDQVARGATTANEIEGDNGLLFDGTSLTVNTLSANNPVVNLSSNTKAAQLEVETNQQLSIKGANSFVFDVSSATGGITFPDGTTQNTAAGGGGGGGPSIGGLQSFQCKWAGLTNAWYCVNEANFGWGSGFSSTTSNDIKWTHSGDAGRVGYYPIYFPEDLTIDYVSVIAAQLSGTPSIDFAIFASDANNFPTGTQLLSWTENLSSTTYEHLENSVAATAFTKGLYFLAITSSSTTAYLLGNMVAGNLPIDNIASAAYKYAPAVTPFCNYQENTGSLTSLSNDAFSWYLAESSATSIPATITLGNLVLGGSARDAFNFKGMIVPALFVRSST